MLTISVDFIKKTKELLDIVSSCSTLHDPNQLQIKAVKVWKMYCDQLLQYRGICPTFH